jgi:hypothetical protein
MDVLIMRLQAVIRLSKPSGKLPMPGDFFISAYARLML